MTKENLFEKDPTLRTVRAKIQCFLDYVDGTFRVTDVYDALEAKTTEEKAAVRQGLYREKQAGTIESCSSYGVYRKIDKSINWLDLSVIGDNGPEPFNLHMPLDLDNLVALYPGDLVVIAGRTNCGKSSFVMELAAKNIDRYPMRYFSCELTKEQIQERAKIEGIKLSHLKHMKFGIRYENYQDVVEPRHINIIDYLTAPGSGDEPRYYAIPHIISKIHEKMDGTGLVLICLQKDPGKRSGEGGYKRQYRSNLYLTLDKDEETKRYWCNIQKCKTRPVIQGYRMNYKPKPFELEPLSDWIPD